MEKDIWFGIDVGSVSVKLAALIRDRNDDLDTSGLVDTGRFFIPEKDHDGF